MSNIMSSSKFALSSSGNILYELKSLDIPTICVSLAKNQKLLVNMSNLITLITLDIINN